MSLQGREFVVRKVLYTEDGKRAVKICEFDNGETYLDEQQWIEGTTFINRHRNRLVGPFKSPDQAERFIITTDWFQGNAP
jgi:hypothetical protein